MDIPRLTRPFLESLSTGELMRLADRVGIDIPYGLERIFIIEELLEYALSEAIEAEEAVDTGLQPNFKETAVLPGQYNISFVEVMIRDPLWAFVFWEIKQHEREAYEKAVDFNGYCLRIRSLNEAGFPAADAAPFTVQIGVDDGAWYLNLPPADTSEAAMAGGQTGGFPLYRVEICVLRGMEEQVIKSSRPFRMPPVPDTSGLKRRRAADEQPVRGCQGNPLSILSGLEDFSLVYRCTAFPETRRLQREAVNE